MISEKKKLRKDSWHNIFFSVLLGVAIFTVVGFLIVSNWKIGQRRAELNSQVEILQQQIWTLETKRQELQSQISQTEGQEYLEREARDTFNLKKAGEEVVIILPAEGEEGIEEERSFWQKIWDKIGF
jgi:cell division protein FtsB